ncbi:aldehyde dehydrogenase 3 A2, partial [Reticulomyxa filosa]
MTEEKYLATPLDEIPNIVGKLRQHFNKNAPFSYEFRIQQLQQLQKLIEENEKEILAVCAEYFKEDARFAVGFRLFPVKYDLGLMLTNLKEYMKPKSISQPFPMNVKIKKVYSVQGVVGIIAPWNFPVSLLLRPLIGAIAAGNCVVLKPSEVTDNVARLIAKLIPKYLDPKIVQVVCGGPKETNAMINAKLDLCMFTGSTFVGKLIMKACAEHLTPVILELGGKNPVFLDDKLDLKVVAKRIMYGRLLNCGQLCLSPEYVFVSKQNVNTLISELRQVLKEFYGDKIETTQRFSHIVNTNHFRRLKKIRDYYLLNDTESKKIVIGGPNDKEFFFKDNEKERFIPPMVLSNVDFEKDAIMAEE